MRWLSQKEEKRLLIASTERLRAIIVFALNTGMRQGEILRLKWPYVDFSRKTVAVMESKNGEKRTIPLNQKAVEVLKALYKLVKDENGFVFTTSADTKILRRNLLRDFYKARKKAKLEDFRFHDLRHTFATRLVQSRIDLYTVSKLLGHKDIRMTQRYAHHSLESLRVGVDVLDKSITFLSHSPVSQFSLGAN